MQPLEPKIINNIGIYGLIRQAEVDDSLVPDGAVTEAINVHFDRKGAVTLREGLTGIGSQISSGYSCLGLYNALFSDSSKNCLLSVFSDGTNNDIYTSTGGNWSKTLQDDTAGAKTRFVTFSDRVIRVNGQDAMKVWDGDGAWDTSSNPINPDDMVSYPTKYIERYKARVYTAGNSTYPDRLFYSSVVDSSGNITWTPGTDYVDISPNDGENISALKRFGTELLVFKPNYIYRFTTSGVDPNALIKIGTRSQESVVEGKKGIYFHNDNGFYLYNGGYPTEKSRPISDFVDAIPYSYYDDITGWADEDHIYWSVGDLTVNGKSYTNVVLRYTESADIWTIYSYATELSFGTTYNNGSTIYRIVGDDNGYVYLFNSGNTDNGTAISYKLRTKWYDLGIKSYQKVLNDFSGICEKAQGSTVFYEIDDTNQPKQLGQLRKYITNFTGKSIKFHRIRFHLRGISEQEPFVFQGFELLKLFNEGYIKQ